MELVLIFAAVIISVLIFIVSFYLLALYCHPEDKEFGASLICKIVVIAGIFLCCA
jgi:LMBR1 domain-containing protein 1